jgi:hypothetical protein
VSGRPKCICPRGRALLDGENRRRAEKLAERGEDRNNIRVPVFMNNTRSQGVPDLSKGKCRSAEGRQIIDDAEGKPPNSLAVQKARNLCADCTVFERCRDWVKRDEKPAGSWGLMYAGMTPRERMRESRGA